MPSCLQKPAGRRIRAFTLIELLLTMVLAGIVVGGAVLVFANFAGTFGERDVTDSDGAAIPLVPAYSQLMPAMQLQVFLTEALETASAAYVLGGVGEDAANPTLVTTDMLETSATAGLSWASSPTYDGTRPVTSAAAFRSFLSGGASATNVDAGSFTLVVIDENNDADPFVIQCKSVSDGTTRYYYVDCYHNGAKDDGLSYKFAITEASVARFSIAPGAVHYWLRNDAAWGVSEELGAQIVLPDPTALPYEMKAGDVGAHPRFMHFIPVRP